MMKKLLFINGNMSIGGVELSLLNLLKRLDYSRYSVDLLLFGNEGDYLSDIPSEVNIIIKDISSAEGNLIKSLMRAVKEKNKAAFLIRLYYSLPKLFSLERIKGIFADLPKYDTAIAYRSGFCGSVLYSCINADKKLYYWHYGITDEGGFNDFCKNVNSAAGITVSEVMKNEIIKAGVDEERIYALPNIIDFSAIALMAEEKTEDLRQGDAINILSVGRLSAEKNYIISPEVVKIIKDKGYKVNYLLIGDGAERSKILQEAERLGVSESIQFLGNKKNPYAYFKCGDVFLHPSLVESQSMTILESFYLGVPVVAVNSNGPSEFMVDGENGFISNPDAELLAENIIKIYSDKNMAQRFVNNAKETLKDYSDKRILEKFYGILENG